MGSLIGDVRTAGKSGNFIYGVLEALTNSKATVKITGSSQRLTNLDVMSSDLAVGDKVVIDYSAGIPPYVRGHGKEITYKQKQLIIGYESAEQPAASDDLFASIIDLSNQIVTKDNNYTIKFSATVFDFNNLYNGVDGFVVPEEGAYYVTAQVVLSGITCAFDHRNRIWMALSGDVYGDFAFSITNQSEADPDSQLTAHVSGPITAALGEEITCRIWLDPEFGQNSCDLIYEGTDDAYATVSPAMQLFRFGGGFFASSMAGLYSQEFSDREDPSRIILDSNTGYLYVGEANEYVRAVANSGQQANQNLALDFQWQDVSQGKSELSLFLRSSIDWFTDKSPTTGYEMRISNQGGFSLWRYNAGVATYLAGYAYNASTLWKKLVFEVDGSNVNAKVWTNGESEPAFQITHLDSSPLSGSGGFQLSHWSISGARWVRIDNVSLTTP
jgi:hypothetical protein